MENFSFLAYPLDHLPFVILVLIIQFSIHEFAHAYAAYKFGDDTAYRLGRVTLNPKEHFDLVGFLFILIAGFGWAKSVPVNPSRFKHQRLMSTIVSLVGPLSNLLLGMISIIIYGLILHFDVLASASTGVQDGIQIYLSYMISFSFLLFVFNLIPLPPLDGYRIVAQWLPLKYRYKLSQNEQWGMLIFLLLVFIPPLRAITITPILQFSQKLGFGWLDQFWMMLN